MNKQIREDDKNIDWFRAASPYINAHRGKTLVIGLAGDWLRSELLPTLAHDLTLLSHLGLRLVLCFGLRAQVDDQLAKTKEQSHIVDGRRVTGSNALATIIREAGIARNELEARLSMGLPNTPMAGARLAITSGNYVTAQPFGVHEGVDFQHTGSVREVHISAINALLDAGHLVLLPPVGYSLTGEVFNVTMTEVATKCAIALRADKLIFFVDSLPIDENDKPLKQASTARVQRMLDRASTSKTDELAAELTHLSEVLQKAVHACDMGIERVHLLESHDPTALLRELYTRDGSGTMITTDRWEHIRPATIADVGGIIELIAPLQANGTLVSRSREELEIDIEHFVVSERDGMVVACAAMYLEAESATAEIACIATHPEYQGEGRADQLLTHLEHNAQSLNFPNARILSTHTGHWFVARGYSLTSPQDLPTSRRVSYNEQRNSKIYTKNLAAT
jgi:amino-acid N-acetyltransferase